MHRPTSIPNGINDTTRFWYSQRVNRPTHYDYNVSTSWIRVVDFYAYWGSRVGTTSTVYHSTLYNNLQILFSCEDQVTAGGIIQWSLQEKLMEHFTLPTIPPILKINHLLILKNNDIEY
jgi:hypothetical protein